MGDLKFSEVIIAIQNHLYNWGTRAYFCPKMKKFAQVSVSKQNLYYNPKVMKRLFCYFSQLYFSLCIFRYKAIK